MDAQLRCDQKSSTHEKGQLDPDKIESEILANERILLAWVRTNIAVMSLGVRDRELQRLDGRGLVANEPATTLIGQSSPAKSKPIRRWLSPSQWSSSWLRLP
jgi:Domain of unknown function (DUF202)